MDYSVQEYLQRQSTEALHGILLYYSFKRDDEYTSDIIQRIEAILLQRERAQA